MIETQARVLAAEQEFAWVEPRPHSRCRQCDPVTGCRSLSIARAFRPLGQHFRVRNPPTITAKYPSESFMLEKTCRSKS